MSQRFTVIIVLMFLIITIFTILTILMLKCSPTASALSKSPAPRFLYANPCVDKRASALCNYVLERVRTNIMLFEK